MGGRGLVGERFVRSTNAHLSDGIAVAKMGHPELWVPGDLVGKDSGGRSLGVRDLIGRAVRAEHKCPP